MRYAFHLNDECETRDQKESFVWHLTFSALWQRLDLEVLPLRSSDLLNFLCRRIKFFLFLFQMLLHPKVHLRQFLPLLPCRFDVVFQLFDDDVGFWLCPSVYWRVCHFLSPHKSIHWCQVSSAHKHMPCS